MNVFQLHAAAKQVQGHWYPQHNQSFGTWDT